MIIPIKIEKSVIDRINLTEIQFNQCKDFGGMSAKEARDVLSELLSELEKQRIYLYAYGNSKLRACRIRSGRYFLTEDNINEIQKIFQKLNEIFTFKLNKIFTFKINKNNINFVNVHNHLKYTLIFNNNKNFYTNNGNIIMSLLLMGCYGSFINKINSKDFSFEEEFYFRFNDDVQNKKDIKERTSFVIEKLRKENFRFSFFKIKFDNMLSNKISIIVFKALLLS